MKFAGVEVNHTNTQLSARKGNKIGKVSENE
jgi:hypothetical protein